MCRVMFRSALTFHPERVEDLMALDEREAIRDVPLLVRSGIVLVAVLVGFVLHEPLGLEPSLVALLGAGALLAISGLDAQDYLADVEWPTLVFFIGLFVMVGALVKVGVIGDIAAWAIDAVGDRYFLTSTVLVFASGALSGIVDNIPYVATMTPLVDDLVQAGDGSAGATSRGGRSPSAPTSAATPPPSAPRPTSWCWASPRATATDLVLAVHEVRPRRRHRDGLHLLAVRRPALLRAGLTRPGTVTPAATPDAAARASRARPSAAPRGSRRTSGRPGRRTTSARGSTARW